MYRCYNSQTSTYTTVPTMFRYLIRWSIISNLLYGSATRNRFVSKYVHNSSISNRAHDRFSNIYLLCIDIEILITLNFTLQPCALLIRDLINIIFLNFCLICINYFYYSYAINLCPHPHFLYLFYCTFWQLIISVSHKKLSNVIHETEYYKCKISL